MMIASLIFCTACVSFVQGSSIPPETHQFDFWVGEWKCSGESYDPTGKATHTDATNSVTHTLGGHVLQENFKGPGLTGVSVSVFDPSAKLWRQTWVDDQGGYIALTGTFADGKMTLQTIARPDRPTSAGRMVFSNITADSFDWNWESSKDSGKTWKLAWHLHYTRVKQTHPQFLLADTGSFGSSAFPSGI